LRIRNVAIEAQFALTSRGRQIASALIWNLGTLIVVADVDKVLRQRKART